MNAQASQLTKKAAILTVSMLAALAAWTATALAAAPSQQLLTSASNVTYPTNPAGQTYGSAAGVPASQEPALIQAIGTGSGGSHMTGYVLKSQLDAATGANAQSPQQAATWMQASHAGTVPLYAQDGKTVIGQFTIAAGNGSSTAAPDTVASSCGDKGYYGPVKGHDYNNYSCIVYNTGPAGSYGDITTEADDYVNVPTGYMGALPRVFKEDGALCIESSWYYNVSSANGITDAVYRPAAACGSGYYHSSGLSRAYNGGGYDTYSSFSSPNRRL